MLREVGEERERASKGSGEEKRDVCNGASPHLYRLRNFCLKHGSAEKFTIFWRNLFFLNKFCFATNLLNIFRVSNKSCKHCVSSFDRPLRCSSLRSDRFAERFGMFVNVNRVRSVLLLSYFSISRKVGGGSRCSRPALCQVALRRLNQYSRRSCAVLSEVAPPVRLLLSLSHSSLVETARSIRSLLSVLSYSVVCLTPGRAISGRSKDVLTDQ